MIPPGTIFAAWIRSGGLAFGGGSVALESLRREMVDRRGWMDEEGFARQWALCQVAPGINLVGFALLIGKELGGGLGAVAAVLGILVPSALVTAVLAAGFAALRSHPAVNAAMHGIVPVTAGLGLASMFRNGRPLIRMAWNRGRRMKVAAVLIPTGSLVGGLCGISALYLLISGAIIGALAWWSLPQ